jgi:hypothetical protein
MAWRYWRIGSAYLFNAASTMARMPQYNAQLNLLLAKVQRTLPNGAWHRQRSAPESSSFRFLRSPV